MLNLPCLPLIQERFLNAIHDQFIEYKHPDIKMLMFPQAWPSTALGFRNVIGQDMLTVAYTTVVCDDKYKLYGVFFNEQLAYIVEDPTDEFFEDLGMSQMGSTSKVKYYWKQGATNDSNPLSSSV